MQSRTSDTSTAAQQLGTTVIKQIISGGQTGADQAGLAAAKELGIPTGGFAPKGWLTEEGPNVALRDEYFLQEANTNDYRTRTMWNAQISDSTIIFGDSKSAGSALTLRHCTDEHKQVLVVPFPSAFSVYECATTVAKWINERRPEYLNIAGNRESKNPGIFAFTKAVLLLALKQGD